MNIRICFLPFLLIGFGILSNGLTQQTVSRVSPENAKVASEISIAINPTNLNNIVAGSLVRGIPESTASNLSYFSFDGGKTWKSASVPNPDSRTQGDDVVLFSRDGTCAHAFISFVGLWETQPSKAANGIALTRSTDGGQTWSEQVRVADHLNSKSPMEDKPWLIFDRTRSSPHYNNLYCSWTRFDVYGSKDPQDTSQIMFARAPEGGKKFEPVIRISDNPGDCLDGDNTLEGAVPCVHPDGTVFVVWSGPRGLEIDQSNDGGKTFGTDRVILKTPGGWNSHVDGIDRHNGMPVTGVDHSFGPDRGSLYVNWIDERNTDKDVFVISSRDKGRTWSNPVRVNTDDQGRDQFFTWMAVDPIDGSINVVFYDRGATTGTRTRLTLARSIDGGKSFQNVPVDFPEFDFPGTEFSNQNGLFFGDYIGIDAIRGRVALAFMHYENKTKISVASAVMDFEPGTTELRAAPPSAEQPEFITVQHLLIAFDGSIPDESVTRTRDEAKQLAHDLFEQAKSGKDFDELVKEHTNDSHPGIYKMANFWSEADMAPEATNEKVFPRALMVQAFGDTGFPLEVGEYGLAEYDATTSKYGWHIIKRIK